MKTFFLLVFASFQYGFSMGIDQFIPGNPADAKDVPEIEDLNNINRHTTTNKTHNDQQREEEKQKDEVTQKAPSRTKEKQ